MEFVKGYVYFMIVLMVASYLTPKEEYRKYVQFFMGILLAVVIIRPIIGWGAKENWYDALDYVNELYEQLGQIEYEGEGNDVYTIFWGNGNP